MFRQSLSLYFGNLQCFKRQIEKLIDVLGNHYSTPKIIVPSNKDMGQRRSKNNFLLKITSYYKQLQTSHCIRQNDKVEMFFYM